MKIPSQRKPKPYKGLGMEGMIATWYAKNTGKSIAKFRDLAKRIAEGLRPGDRVLEVALFRRPGKNPVPVQSRSTRDTRANAAPSISPGWPSALATLRSISKMSRF
jgi:hypothetical protein